MIEIIIKGFFVFGVMFFLFLIVCGLYDLIRGSDD